MTVLDEYKWRDMITNITDGLSDLIASETVTAYIGFDPSAASLHVGSLLPAMALARLQRHGHRPIAIIGGGTGLIGDPSGKSQERSLLSKVQVEKNLEGIRTQLGRFLDFDSKRNAALIVNNADWLTTISMMDFLRDVGKYFTVNYMLAKESVSRRLEQQQGISFTESSYMLLQAYDFLILHDRFQCTLQMGGSDQWGNILAGIELIRRLSGKKAHGLVFPLVTSASGVKFGKTEAGAIWLDANLTSPFRFYQFWLNTDDRDVIAYLKYFTWLNQKEIHGFAESVERTPEKREAQRILAKEMTQMLHGESALHKAEKATQVLFGAEISNLGARDILEIFSDVPSTQISVLLFETPGLPLADVLVTSGLAESKGEARRLIKGGGIYLNNMRVSDERRFITKADTVESQVLVLRKGQKQYHIVQLTGEA